MKVPFLDLAAPYLELKAEIDEAISRVLQSGWYVLGEEVEAFEAEWAAYCGARHAVGVANGLDALILALRALGVGKGDEVIVPSNTYIATWLAVSAVGATPIPVEPDERTFNINPRLMQEAISNATRAVIPVHLYGQPVDLDPILAIAREANLHVIEDAAQAHGAIYKGRRIGAHSDVVCWSFYPGKNLGAFGDAGAITTNSEFVSERIKVLRNYGSRVKYVNETLGANSRLDPIQAAVLRVKLRYLDEWTQRRHVVASNYDVALRGVDLIVPTVPAWCKPVWHLYVVRSAGRTQLQERLTAAGVGTLIHYPIPPHMQRAYSCLSLSEDDFPIAKKLANDVLSLPIGPHLSHEAVQHIIDAIVEGY